MKKRSEKDFKMASSEDGSTKSDGQLWTVWAENFGCQIFENEDDETEEEKKKRESDAMKLRQEDMPLFGFCPAWDEFYLVVCELCGYVIKPQALKNHIELRHGTTTLARSERSEAVGQHTKVGINNKGGSSSCQMALVSSGRSSSASHSVKSSSPNHPSSRPHTKPGSNHCHGTSSSLQLNASHNAIASSRPKSENSSKLKKNNSMAPFVRVERMPDDILKTTSVHAVNSLPTDKKELPSPQQPPPNINVTSLNSSGIKPGHASPSLPSSFSRTIDSGTSNNTVPLSSMGGDTVSSNVKRQSGSSKSKRVPKERKLLLCKDREYDPNKHCGVKVAETGKPCTRSLTCKTHSLSLRRAVIGRKKNFDELLADHRAAKETALKATQSQASGASEHQTSNSCQIQQIISDSIGIPNSTVLSSKLGSGTKSSSSSGSSLSKSNKQVLKNVKHASSKTVSHSIPVNRPSSHSGEVSKSPASLSETQVPQLQESATESSNLKISSQDPHYIIHHPRPAAVCTFGLRQLGNGLFLLDRRWDLPRAAFRAAVCTERASHPPPLKKLCVESRLPPVPEPVDPSDPYSFTCSEPAASQPCRNLNTVMGEVKSAVSTPLHSGLARPSLTVNNKSSLQNSSATNAPKPPQSKPIPNKVKVREKPINVNRNGTGNASNSVKKKRSIPSSSVSTGGNSIARTSNVSSFPSTTGGVALTTQTLPLIPLTIGDHLGALSQLQVSTHLVANRNSLALSPAVVRSQSVATLQSGTPSRGTKDGVVVTGVDVLNGQLPVTSALLHSVAVSRPCGAMPTLLATPSGLGITVGATGLVGQLSHLQKTTNSGETELSSPGSSSSKGSNKNNHTATSVSGPPNNNLTTTCATSSTWSAKSKTKVRKSSTNKSAVIINHTATVTHALGMGLLLENTGNSNANNSGLNNHLSPQTLSSPSATPSPLLRSDSVSPQVPVSSPLHNGLGPSPPPFPSQKSVSSNTSGASIINHAASVSPASRTSTPSPSTDLSSPGSTGSGPKGKSSSRHSGSLQKMAATSGSGHGTFHLSMPPPVNLSALPVVTAGTRSSQTITYQQVFTSQMLSSAQLNQLQIQTVGKHNSKSTPVSTGTSPLTLATATMPLNFPGLLTASGIAPTVSSSTQKQQQHPLLLRNEDTRRTVVQMQGSPSLPT